MTRKLTGKAYYKQWSMNVKVEGKSVCRNIDYMTHNHGSYLGNTAPFPFFSNVAPSGDDSPCAQEKEKIIDACAPKDPASLEETPKWNWTKDHCADELLQICPVSENCDVANNLSEKLVSVGLPSDKYTSLDSFADAQASAAETPCLKAKKCELVSKTSSTASKAEGSKGKEKGCCNGQTGHHVIPKTMATQSGCVGYDESKAPCICVEGTSWHKGSHKTMHTKLADNLADKVVTKAVATGTNVVDVKFSMDEVIDAGAESVIAAFPESECSKQCIAAQLREYHNDCPSEMGPVGNDAKDLFENHNDVLSALQDKIDVVKQVGGNKALLF